MTGGRAMKRFRIGIFLGVILVWLNCYLKPYPPRPISTESSAPAGKSDAILHEFPAVMREKLILRIRHYLGTPYRYRGTSRAGMDCSGLVMTVFKEALGIQLPHSSEQLSELGKQIPNRQWKTGDLVFFRTGRTRQISHVGIYLFASKFVHSSTSRGVVISDFNQEDYYQKRYAGARRVVAFQ